VVVVGVGIVDVVVVVVVVVVAVLVVVARASVVGGDVVVAGTVPALVIPPEHADNSMVAVNSAAARRGPKLDIGDHHYRHSTDSYNMARNRAPEAIALWREVSVTSWCVQVRTAPKVDCRTSSSHRSRDLVRCGRSLAAIAS